MKMTSLALILALPAACLLTAPASAQKLDLGKVKCGDWLKMPKDNIAMTLVWLDGYYQDQDADPIIDFNKFGKNAEKLGEACSKSPGKSLGDVAEELFGDK